MTFALGGRLASTQTAGMADPSLPETSIPIARCPYCPPPKGNVRLDRRVLAGIRTSDPSDVALYGGSGLASRLMLFGGGEDGPCQHALLVSIACVCGPRYARDRIRDDWTLSIAWRNALLDEVDLDGTMGPFLLEVLAKRCDVGLRPTVPYRSHRGRVQEWWAGPGEPQRYYQVVPEAAFARDARRFAAQLVSCKLAYEQFRDAIDQMRRW